MDGKGRCGKGCAVNDLEAKAFRLSCITLSLLDWRVSGICSPDDSRHRLGCLLVRMYSMYY